MNFARKTDKVFTIIYTIISILSIIIDRILIIV